ncbi:putative ribonuclease H-like domain-containing protein [Tanacetum coccineum]
MLADLLLPIPFWAEAINTACYVLNRVLVTKPQNKTPYELLIGNSPSISFMRPFGCPLTILNTLDSLDKFDGKSYKGYLLGYSTTSKAFRVYNKRTKRVEENLHINFLENQLNVAGTGPNWMFDLDFFTNSMNYIPVSIENQVNVDAGTQDSYVAGSSGKDKGPTQEYILLPLQPHRTRIPVEDVPPAAHEKPSKSSSKDNDIQDSEDAANKESEQDLQDELEMMITQELAAKAMDDISRQAFEEEKRRIASQKKVAQATSTNKLSTDRPSVSTDRPFVSTNRSNSAASTPTGANAGESSFVYLGGKIPIDASTLPNADLPIDPNMSELEDASDTLSNDGIFNRAYDDNEDVGAVADFNNMDNTIAVSLILTLRIHKDHPKGQILGDPTSAVQTRGKIQKASLAQQAFVEAIQEELLQFKLQKVWVLVDLPFEKKVISTKWVFRNKKDERSIVVKNKAWLVAQGFRQEEGIDYDVVFAPVARIEAIRLFLAFASYMGFTVYQMDVKSAFLYGTIEEEVYVHQPPGFVDPAHPNKVYKVIKSLYGLHQAPRVWYEKLSTFLMKNGFRRGTIDKTLFIKKKRSDIMLVQVYVDDIIFGSTKKSMCTEFEESMHKRFQMSSMGELTFFLGLQVKQQPDRIFISQDKYVADTLKKFDFLSIRTATTPIESNKPLVKDEDGVDVDVHVCRSMIGSLMYLITSRPNIMFGVCACARFQVTPKSSHLNAVKSNFMFLKHKPKLGLWYPRDSLFELEAYSDSDYGGASLDRKSTTGGCQFLGRRLISWQCKKQTIMANSTTEAEYVAAPNCCGHVLWIQNQMMDYGFNFMNTKIHIDNESTISVIKNPVAHSRTKHIKIHFHFQEIIIESVVTIEGEGDTSKRPSDSQTIPSPPHPSVDQPQTQTNPSPRPSPSIVVPDSIPEGSGGNHGGQSSNDASLSGNEDGLTLQSVYDLCVSLCKQVTAQAKEIKGLKAQVKKLKKGVKPLITHHKAWMKTRLARKTSLKKKGVHKEYVSKQGRKSVKSFKGEPFVHKDLAFDDLNDFVDVDDTLDYMETEDDQNEGMTSFILIPSTISLILSNQKTEGNSDFHEIVDFLASSSIHHALTVSPTIYTSYIEQFGHCQVLALESIKDAQAAEISALKIRINRLEKKCKPSISHHRAWLKSVQRLSMKKRFRKKEYVSKQGRKKSKPKSTLDDSTVFDDQDADHGMEYMEIEELGSGDKGGNTKELVSTARPEVSTARQEDSAVELRTPPTTTSIFDNEDITMAQTLIKIKEEKAKEKGVSIKDVDDSSRPERSILTLKLLPTIDPKDKGKGVLKESPVKEVKRSNLDAVQIAKDAKIARLVHEKDA